MQQFHDPDIEVGDSKEREIVVIGKVARVPGHDKYAEAYNDAEQLNRDVKKQEAIETGQVNSGQCCQANQYAVDDTQSYNLPPPNKIRSSLEGTGINGRIIADVEVDF
jgi:Ni/Co efflux regulator RcnB